MRQMIPVVLILALGIGCHRDPVFVDEGAADALAWIEQTASPIAATAPTTSDADLANFMAMVGSARIIGLGEATHGSREFFTMKDRLLRRLVEEGGVTAFAMETTMPEAFAIDAYVRTGVGDPAILLSHLYVWPWNTQEVAELIAWLRDWNSQHPDQPVGFYGFDMQYPGVAMDSVTSYVGRVAPSLSATIAADYACLMPFRNDDQGKFAHDYSTLDFQSQTACDGKLEAAYQLLDSQRGDLVAASSERQFELARQMAYLVWQFNDVMAQRSGGKRDNAMAGNIRWLVDHEANGGRVVVWAHNYHVSRYAPSMGWRLDKAYGAAYLAVGFAFSSGGLNALEGIGNGVEGSIDGPVGPLGALTAPPPVADAYEATMQLATLPNYYVDLRQATPAAAAWLDRAHRFRSIGTVYYVHDPEYHYTTLVLPSIYDVMVFIKSVSPSSLLPFQY